VALWHTRLDFKLLSLSSCSWSSTCLFPSTPLHRIVQLQPAAIYLHTTKLITNRGFESTMSGLFGRSAPSTPPQQSYNRIPDNQPPNYGQRPSGHRQQPLPARYDDPSAYEKRPYDSRAPTRPTRRRVLHA
jgi:hypothetical protein